VTAAPFERGDARIWNHRSAMQRGFEGLARELERVRGP
jgi:hypothetical protein